MSTELNQKALREATNLFYQTSASLPEAIKAYLEACDAPAEPEPFDPSKVKPGDAVLIEGGPINPYRFIGVTTDGLVVTESRHGGVGAWEACRVTILPKPRKTIRVKAFKSEENGSVVVVQEYKWESCPWLRPVSQAVEIEVTE